MGKPEKVIADKQLSPEINALTHRIIGACIEVHKALGPGLVESIYEVCLCRELELSDLPFRRQVPLPIEYKGVRTDAGYRLDLIVDERVIVELKSVEMLLPVHEAQIITYLKVTGLPAGLLVNFNTTAVARGVRRFANTNPKISANSAPLR
jgi:GxxExxY protein